MVQGVLEKVEAKLLEIQDERIIAAQHQVHPADVVQQARRIVNQVGAEIDAQHH
jgi:hypothetical protein